MQLAMHSGDSHEVGFTRIEAEREVIKLPKRSRTSKQQQQPPPPQQLVQASASATGSVTGGNAMGFPVESTSAAGSYHHAVDTEGSHVLGGGPGRGGEPLVARSGTRIRIKPMVGGDGETTASVDNGAGQPGGEA